MANPALLVKEGVRVAIEGCGHGTLHPIYAAVESASAARGWPGVDLLIICGDFQATRNGHDLEVMSVPAKYRALGDFHEYYSGARRAPYLTIFIGGNHEAAGYMHELHYGGWVAPNMYYLGAANVLRFGPLRIAGLSGIWKGGDYRKPHGERLPFGRWDVKTFYHVREVDVRKLLLLREQVDVGLSHDWPRGIEKHGNVQALYAQRPMWKDESLTGTLGSVAAEYLMDRLRPAYWFSGHMHWKFTAIKTYPPPGEGTGLAEKGDGEMAKTEQTGEDTSTAATTTTAAAAAAQDPNEIELDLEDDDDEDTPVPTSTTEPNTEPAAPATPIPETDAPNTSVPDALRAQLPAAFTQVKPQQPNNNKNNSTPPGQPVPATITNTTVRFLALNKCLPGREFLQLADLQPVDPAQLEAYPPSNPASDTPNERYSLQYDPEWLAITRLFHLEQEELAASSSSADDTTTPPINPAQIAPPNKGEQAYLPLIAASRDWINTRIPDLTIPQNFAQTAPPLLTAEQGGDQALWSLHSGVQPREYTNPQTAAFCAMLGVRNFWDASEEEREERRAKGPAADGDEQGHRGGGFGHGGQGRGRGWGGGGRGRGRGGFGRGGGRGSGRGRGGRGRGGPGGRW
ncbi:lariat debranching enzyme, C-terminal domain-domain-containing protein [Coniella lustricola]|uniref:Lariat debranching enzyme, C-terminal domain-domain-containing protein n=1 Tax=Coniella lustricola TaxID=2025994 RepID=A0A2T3A813_9PEZI|nr:lariat debranching enzyme, C-terminal domain-domain-containing protein [Coniella lustricola]